MKFLSVSKIFLVYDLFGCLICFIISIIPTIFPCSNNNTFENIICTVKNIDNKNSIIYYYDNYFAYFKDLWKKEEIYYNIYFIFIVIFKII